MSVQLSKVDWLREKSWLVFLKPTFLGRFYGRGGRRNCKDLFSHKSGSFLNNLKTRLRPSLNVTQWNAVFCNAFKSYSDPVAFACPNPGNASIFFPRKEMILFARLSNVQSKWKVFIFNRLVSLRYGVFNFTVGIAMYLNVSVVPTHKQQANKTPKSWIVTHLRYWTRLTLA